MNKIRNSLAHFMLIALFVSVFSNIAAAQAAFGVSPPWINNDHMLPGSSYEETIYLSRNETEQAMKPVIKMSGDEQLVEWIDIPDEANLVMEKDQTIIPMKVLITVPERAALKDYEGAIEVSLMPVQTNTSLEGGEVAIALGAYIAVNISVTGNQVTDYNINSVTVEAKEEEEPISVSMTVQNSGNTEINSISGQIDVYNSNNTEVLTSVSPIPLDEPLAPYESKDIEVVFDDFKPDAGSYWVAVKATKEGEIIYEDRFPQKVGHEEIIITRADSPEIESPQDEITSDLQTAAQKRSKNEKMYLIFGFIGIIVGLMAFGGILLVPRPKKKRKGKS